MTDLAIRESSPDWFADVPRSITRHAILGLTLMAVAIGGFLYWAFTAPLAAAVIAQGSFVATGRNKIVQHLEGGIIEEIFVREGQSIHAGEPILSLDRTSAETSEREYYLREIRLQATSERLLAEYREAEMLSFSGRLRDAAATDGEVAAMLEGQKLTFDITRKSLLSDLALLQRNIEALRIRERGYGSQLEAFALRSEIIDEEVDDKTALLDRQLVSRSEVNELRRIQAEASGQLARLSAELDEVRQMRLKHESEIDRARSAYREAALDELGPIAAELESVREKAREARSVLDRSIVRAPVSGTVVRMHYHTPAGVIETGKPIAEILPTDAPLIIEAQIARTEIDSVALDQHTNVRLTALNQRTTPTLDGRVFYISADALSQETSNLPEEIYVVRVSIPPEELDRIPGFVPTPGMPAEVMIETEERTFADYLTKPILDSFSRAFREQ